MKKLEKKLAKPLKLLARLRKMLQKLTQRPAFTATIIGTVLLSCVVLALNAPYALYMTPRLSGTLDVLEILCTSIFTLESVIFFIADGPSHYLRSGAHVFELVSQPQPEPTTPPITPTPTPTPTPTLTLTPNPDPDPQPQPWA